MYAADHATTATPVGMVRVAAQGDRLTRIAIEPVGAEDSDALTPALREAIAQLHAYFDGRLAAFDLPLAPASTPRGDVLRAALIAIPRGETVTYGAVAAAHGSSARAIGGVCRTNPFPIVVPCHRVVSTGATEFYSAGEGPTTKRWLLDHERRWRI